MAYWVRIFLLYLVVVALPAAGALLGSARTALNEADRVGSERAAAASRAVDGALLAHAVGGWGALRALELRPALAEVESGRPGKRVDAFVRAVSVGEQALGFLVAGDQIFPSRLAPDVKVLTEFLGHEFQTKDRVRGVWTLADTGSHTYAALAVRNSAGRLLGYAVLLRTIDKALVRALAADAQAELSLVRGFELDHSTLTADRALPLIEPALSGRSRYASGRLATQLPSALPEVGPLLIGPWAQDLAYASEVLEVQGSEHRWVVSASREAELSVAGRIEVWILLTGLMASFVVFVFARMMHRAYVGPLDRVTEHFAKIQASPETLQSLDLPSPGRLERLVRLVNLTFRRLRRSSGSHGRGTPIGRVQLVQRQAAAPPPAPVPTERPGRPTPAPLAARPAPPTRPAPSPWSVDDLDDLALSRALMGELTISTMADPSIVIELPMEEGWVIEIEPEQLKKAIPVDEHILTAPGPEERRRVREVFEAYLDLRRKCGESTEDLDFKRFVGQVLLHRIGAEAEHGKDPFRYEVYEANGRARLRLVSLGLGATG